jgi:hypothetical protein
VTVDLILGGVLAVLVVVFVARPFLRDPAPSADNLDRLDAAARRRLQHAEERDRALGALKELELDHRTGKITDDDYRALAASLRRRAAEALRALEPPEPPQTPEPYPPPGELDPPTQPDIPEPYPPPGEADPPQPPEIPEPYPERTSGPALDAGRSSR